MGMKNERVRDILEKIKKHEISSKEGMKRIARIKQEEEEGSKGSPSIEEMPAGTSVPYNAGIAIIGMAAKFPDANNIDELWDNLVEGRNSIREADRWRLEDFYDPNPGIPGKSVSKWGGFISGIDQFDPLFFNMSPKEAELMDPQQRLFLKEAWRSLEDAGYSDKELDNRKCGVFVGFNTSDYIKTIEEKNVPLDGYMLTGNNESVISGRVSYYLNLKGPSMTLNTACSSSLVAAHLACESIRCGTCDMAIAGGVTVMVTKGFHTLLSSTGMLSPEGQCKTFDNEANGFVPGEGVGAVVLKRLDKALEDGDHIYAVIAGSGINQDGKTNGITAPSSPSQTALELEVYQRYGINPENIGCVETHGTGTKLGDPIEVDALTAAFHKYTSKKQFCALGSIKTNIGHTLAAAGIAGLIKAVLSVSRKKLVPSLNLEKENEMINFKDSPFYVNTTARDWTVPEGHPRMAAVSSFGFSGTNAHMVIKEWKAGMEAAETKEEAKWRIYPFSAKSSNSLRQKLVDFSDWLDRNGDCCRPCDISYTLLVGRSHFQHTAVFTARDMDQLKKDIKAAIGGTKAVNFVSDEVKETRVKADPAMKQTGEKYIKDIAENRVADEEQKTRLMFLAELYAKGYELDWKVLFENDGCRRIPLPGYSFDEERYWVGETDTGIDGNSRTSLLRLHPLVDENISSFKGQKFKKTLTVQEFFVTDHRVEGNRVFPGAGYIEMACASGAIAGDKKVRGFKNIVWAKPITVTDARKDVYISLYPSGEGAEYEVSTRDEKGSEVIHSQGKLSFEENSGDEPIDIAAVRARCLHRRESKDCYSLFNKIGMGYGPAFRTIRWLCNNHNEALAWLELPEEQRKSFKEYIVHPSIMDGALQAAVGLAQDLTETSDSPYLPFGIGEINIYSSLPEKCYVYVTPAGNGQRDTSLLKYDVKIAGEDGTVLLSMQDFSVRMLEGKAHTGNAEKLYMERVWVQSPLKAGISRNFNKRFILFDTGEDMYRLLGARAADVGNKDVILVKPGQGFQRLDGTFEINPSDPGDYTKLVESLQKTGKVPQNAIFMWGHEEFKVDGIDLEQQQRGIFSLLHFIKAMMKSDPREKLRIQFVHRAEKAGANPFYEAIGAFARSLRLENPGYILKTLQLDTTGNDSAKVLEIILDEFEADEDMEVRCQNGTRYIRTLVQQSLAAAEEKRLPLKHKGVYLITGGMGGLGCILASYLAKEYKAKLVLTGRTPLNAVMEQRIRMLEEYGAEVLYVATDVSRREEVARLFAAARERFTGVNGILHSAGVIRDSMLMNKNVESFMEVLGPKVYGTIWLDQESSKEPLDFYVLFSAGASVIGNAGQCDYAYANGFMDSYAGRRVPEGRQGKTLAINWPFWKNGGMVLPEEGLEAMKHAGMVPLRDEEGIKAFMDGLASDKEQVIVFYGDAARIKKALASRFEAVLGEEIPIAAPEGKEKVKWLEEAEQYLKGIMSKVIRLPAEKINSKEPLEKYGIDSVMIIGLNRELEACFGELPKTLFFEYQTVRELAGYFVQKHLQTLLKNIHNTGNAVGTSENTAMEGYDKLVSIKDRLLDAPIQPVNKEAAESDDIAIIGIHGRYPMAGDMEAFWNNLVDGKDCISEIPMERWDHSQYYDADRDAGKVYSKWGGFIQDADKFDPLFFQMTPRDAEIADPQERIFLESVYHAIEDAGYTKARLDSSNVGVYVGVMYGHYQMFGAEETMKGNVMALNSSYSSIANRVSYFFNFHGPSIALDTMCSSSLTAVHLACESLKNNEIDVAVAGGVNLTLHPSKYIMLSQGKFAASDGRCRSFGAGGDGYVPSEGVGTVILKPLAKAKRDGDRVYAVIKGTAVNHGGKTNGYTVPNPKAQTEVISRTLKKAGIHPRTISYMEAHGTGTSLGDPIEITGLSNVFGEYTSEKQFCPIGSVKSNIGHAEAAAGVAGIAKVLLQMKHKKLVPSIHAETLNPNINFNPTPFYVQKTLSPWEQPVIEENGVPVKYPRRAGISSFGAGGSNAHILLEEYEEEGSSYKESPGEKNIFVLSARSKERLVAYANEILSYLERQQTPGGSGKMGGICSETLVVKDMVTAAAYLLNIDESEIDVAESLSDFGFDRVLRNHFINELIRRYELDVAFPIPDEYDTLSALAKYLADRFSDKIAGYYEKTGQGDGLTAGSSSIRLCDIAYTLQTGRDAMEERLAVVVSSIGKLCEVLKVFVEGKQTEGLYTGRVAAGREADSLEKEEEIERLLKTGEYDRLARAWASGANVDWQKLYPVRHPRIVTLPNYPFLRKRIWFGSFKGSTAAQAISAEESVRAKTEVKTTPAPAVPVRAERLPDTAPKIDINKTRIQWDTVEDFMGNEVALDIIDGQIALVTLQEKNRKNMLSEQAIKGLMAKFAEIAKNEAIKAVIITGYDNVFCMGGTQEQLTSIADRESKFTDVPFLYRGLLDTEVPVIAAIQGHASGGGLLFGLSADIVVMSEESVYSAVFTKYGFTPGMGATYVLKEKFGINIANEMMYTAKSFSGSELKERGAPVIIRKRQDVVKEAISTARILAEKPRHTLKVLKQELAGRLLEQLLGCIEREAYMHELTFSHPEVKKRIEYYYLDSKRNTRETGDADEKAAKPPVQTEKRKELQTKETTYDQEALQQDILDILSSILYIPAEEINGDVSFRDMGVDSISGVEIVRDMNRKFSLNLDAVVLYDYSTVKTLTEYIAGQIGAFQDTAIAAKEIAVAADKKESEIVNLLESFKSDDLSEDEIVRYLEEMEI